MHLELALLHLTLARAAQHTQALTLLCLPCLACLSASLGAFSLRALPCSPACLRLSPAFGRSSVTSFVRISTALSHYSWAFHDWQWDDASTPFLPWATPQAEGLFSFLGCKEEEDWAAARSQRSWGYLLLSLALAVCTAACHPLPRVGLVKDAPIAVAQRGAAFLEA